MEIPAKTHDAWALGSPWVTAARVRQLELKFGWWRKWFRSRCDDRFFSSYLDERVILRELGEIVERNCSLRECTLELCADRVNLYPSYRKPFD
jgi:hypothetical protein